MSSRRIKLTELYLLAFSQKANLVAAGKRTFNVFSKDRPIGLPLHPSYFHSCHCNTVVLQCKTNLQRGNIMTCQTEAIAYRKAGLSLALITPNSKRPAMNNWNQLNVCNSIENIPDGYGIGLVHTHSGTMALDIDDWDNTLNTLLLAGINLVELCENSSIIVSGKKNRCKLIFKMPDGLILPTKKLTFEVDKKIRTFLEFR